MTDAERERLIEAWRTILELEKGIALKRVACANMTALIQGRSPRKVAEMEQERRLA